MIIDTHAHLADNKFRQDFTQVLERAKEKGVEAIIDVGYSLSMARKSLSLAKKYAIIYASVGIHPHDAESAKPGYIDELRKMAAEEKVVAIGEMGLDFYRNLSPPAVQEKVFREQIALAREVSLPIIVHDRDAHQQVLKILQEEEASQIGGVLHCFSGDWELAKKCLDIGFYISIAGPVTFKKNKQLQEVAEKVPQEFLLAETDSPYLAPVPLRGKRNEPANVALVLEEMARLRGESYADLARQTTNNARKLFGLS